MADAQFDSEFEIEPKPKVYPSILSIKDAACYLTISTYYLYGLVKARCVPYAKIGKRIIFRQKDLFEWVGENTIPPVNPVNYEDENDIE